MIPATETYSDGYLSTDPAQPGDGGAVMTYLTPVEFITPAGDPVTAPVDAGNIPSNIPDGANEFTFSDATPGVLTVKLKARVTGFSALPSTEKAKFKFELDAIGNSTFAWDSANTGGTPTLSGDVLSATATYTELPQNNSDFGEKKARIKYDTTNVVEAKFEVFFPRDKGNSPNNQVGYPNWFYYWEQEFRANGSLPYTINYELGLTVAGKTPAMTDWSYTQARDKTEVIIGAPALGKYKMYNVNKERSGIDAFFGTVIHEGKHVSQIALADQLVPTGIASSPWAHGWSWNVQHNHWEKGADGEWGEAGVDDDNNSIIDDAAAAPPFEPGYGDDLSLDHSVYPSWPKAWTLPSPNDCPHPIESAANNEADLLHNEHDKARFDWGNPGKNHKTIDFWDD